MSREPTTTPCPECGTLCHVERHKLHDHYTPAPLDVERLAAAMNDAQIDASELQLGRDLRPVADRILACLFDQPSPEPRCPRCGGRGLPMGHRHVGGPFPPLDAER